ncbi:hypothetical protein SprV_0200798100 [Sparganum proliferum]
MHSQSRVSPITVRKLLFGDDCTLNATSEGDMQRITDLFATACDNFGLVINTEKTVFMYQLRTRNTKTDDEVARRISKFSQALGGLHIIVCNRQGLYLNTKLEMHKAVILPMLLYAAETQTVYKKRA